MNVLRMQLREDGEVSDGIQGFCIIFYEPRDELGISPGSLTKPLIQVGNDFL